MASVELIAVTKRFGAAEAVAGVDLRIADGEFVTLLGPSGCGKTTTLNLIAGLEAVTSGEIRLDGAVVNHLTPYQRDVAMVFQHYALYPQMTVAENIGFSMRLRRQSKDEIRRRVEAVADLLELGPLLGRLPRELSGGQQQRVALGRAVIREPRVFLFDEPLSNLDAALRVRMRAEIKQLHTRLGITSIFVTHDQEEAMSMSDRIATMRNGRVEQFGSPEEVYAQPATIHVARFIGSPQTDVLHGEVVAKGEVLGYRAGAAWFPLPPRLREAVEQRAATPVDLAVRAEHVLIADEGVEATVTVNQPIGPTTYVTAVWDGGSLTARLPGIVRLAPGARVRLALDPAGVMLFARESGERVG